MLFLPPRFYPNHVVKIGALTVLLTSLSVFFVTHTGAHARAHTHTHTHTSLSISGLLSGAGLTVMPHIPANDYSQIG